MKLAGTRSLLETLSQLEREPRWDDRGDLRRWPRMTVRGEAELHPIDRNHFDRTPIDVSIRDISPCGLGFVSTHAFEPDTVWRCGFLREGHTIGQQAIVIRHCAPLDDGIFLVGGQFVLEPAILAMLDAV